MDAPKMLEGILRQSISGNLALFQAHWHNWSRTYEDLLWDRLFVIDQLQREGHLFSSLSAEVIPCAGYILISSTGILHHHNVSSIYKKLTYFYPVSSVELAPIDTENKLNSGIGEMSTMSGMISFMEGRDVQDLYVEAVRKHYDNVRRKGRLEMLLAVVLSKEVNEAINGSIWEDVLDPNYCWVDQDKMVKVADNCYIEELQLLLERDKVNYKKVLIDLLSDEDIMNEVGNSALGVHVEALLISRGKTATKYRGRTI